MAGKTKGRTKGISRLSLAIAVALSIPAVFASPAPDTTGVWYHIRHKQTALANAEFKRLQQKHPEWEPGDALSQAIYSLNHPPALTEIVDRVTPTNTETSSGNEPDEMSVLLGQLASMNEGQWQTLSGEILDRTEGYALTERNDDALLLVGWINMARHHYARAKDLFSEVSDNKRKPRNDAIAAAIDAQVFNAIDKGDRKLLEELYASSPEQTRPLISGAAWEAFDSRAMVRANVLFEIIDERLGRVLSLAEMNFTDEAIALACSTEGNTEIDSWCNSQLAADVVANYETRNYAAAISAAEQLSERQALNPELKQLFGWSLANAGEFSRARTVFGELLKRSPDDESVQGAFIHAYQYDAVALQPFADRYPFVAEFIAKQHGELAWGRKQFDLANRSGIERSKATTDSDLQAYTGLTTRHRSGLRGLGHLDEQAGYAGMSAVLADTRIDLSVRHERLFAGNGNDGEWFGGGRINDGFTGNTMQTGQGIEVDITRQLKDWTGYGNLGYLLIDQPVSTRITGALGGTYFQKDWQFSMLAYRQRRKDSMLSQTGTHWWGENPFATAWGGVLQTGVKGLGVKTLEDHWAVSASFNFAELDGERVKDNGTYSLRLDLSRDLTDWFDSSVPLDYLRAAPYVGWQQYDHDLSDFTQGQGGYFSPQRFFSTGVSAEVLTAEARHWQVRSRVSLGWSSVYEEGGRRFPLDSNAVDEAPASEQKGISADIYIEGQYQIAEHWSVAGYVSRSHAVAYQSTFAGIELRWYAASRRGVTSDTLFSAKPALKEFLF